LRLRLALEMVAKLAPAVLGLWLSGGQFPFFESALEWADSAEVDPLSESLAVASAVFPTW